MKRGFTLVEMIVALMIFSMVAVVALAALVKIIDANRKAQTIQDAVVNMSFVMESMTRELRTGSVYYCKVLAPGIDLSLPPGNVLTTQTVTECGGVNGISANGVGFAFQSNRMGASNACRLITAYEIVPNRPGGVFDGTFLFNKALQSTCGGSITFTPVIDVDTLSIKSYFVNINNNQFPLFYIKLDGSAGSRESIKTLFTIQTAASPRLP